MRSGLKKFRKDGEGPTHTKLFAFCLAQNEFAALAPPTKFFVSKSVFF